MSSQLEQTSKELKASRLVINKLGDTFDAFQVHYRSILSLAEQWKSLESDFNAVDDLIVKRVKELEDKEIDNAEKSSKIHSLFKRVEVRQNRLDLLESSLSKRMRVVETREKDLKECYEAMEVEKREIDERRTGVELKESRYMEVLDRIKGLDEREADVNKRWEEVELEKVRVRALSEEVELDNIRVRVLREEVNSEKVRVCELSEELRRKERGVNERDEKLKERIREVELKEDEMSMRCRTLGMKEERLRVKEKEMDEVYEALEMREKEMIGELKLLASREKLINDAKCTVESKEKEVERRSEVLELKEKDMHELGNVLEAKEKDVNELREVLASRENLINDATNVVELKKKEVERKSEALELKEKDVHELGKVLEVKVKDVIELGKVLVSRENLINNAKILVESKEKEVGRRLEALETKEKDVNELGKVLEVKEKNVNELQKVLEAKKRETSTGWGRLKSKEKEVNTACESVARKEKQLNALWEALEVNEKEVSERGRMLELEEKRINDRFQVLELKEKMNERHKAVEVEEGESVKLCQTREVKMKDVDKHVKVLMPCQAMKSSNGMELKQKPANDVCQAEVLKKKQFDVPCEVIESKKTQSSDKSLKVASVIHSLCVNMDADGIKSYLLQDVKRLDKRRDMSKLKISDALSCASDPAKLVLEVCRRFQEPNSSKFAVDACKDSVIFLLEMFMNLSSSISPIVRDDARALATIWRSGMRGLADNFGFLLFITAYNISSNFLTCDLISCISRLITGNNPYRLEQTVHLCCRLGLADEIPGHVKCLIEGDKLLSAVKFVCVFKLQTSFPPVPLLKAYLEHTKKRVSTKFHPGDVQAKIAANQKELDFLLGVVSCISNFKLKSEYPPGPLQLRINELQREVAASKLSRKRAADSSPAVQSVVPFKHCEKRPRVGTS